MFRCLTYLSLIFSPFFLCGQKSIQHAEYFWGLSDPGQGNGTAMLAFDGNFNEALETVIKSSASLPSGNGYRLINIRVKDYSGNWGPLYKRRMYQYDSNTSNRDISSSSAVYL